MKFDRDILVGLINAGYSQTAIAEKMQVTSVTVSQWCKRHGLRELFWHCRDPDLCNHGRRKPFGERELTMKARYEAGETLQQIATDYGMTRERVRQLLTKHFGFDQRSGGQSKRAAEARAKRKAAQDAKYMAKWGHDFTTHKSLIRLGHKMMETGVCRERTPIGAFTRQWNNARCRGIAWQFTLADWWAFWQESGKWEQRGVHGSEYVMCRLNDEGPYSRENCYIATSRENLQDYFDRRDIVAPFRRAA